MKIAKSIRDLYYDQKHVYEKLKTEVDKAILGKKEVRWHYESRIKEIESLALKIETGRFSDLKNMEDFFACTLVVENLNNVSQAEDLIRDMFNLVERRPRSDKNTHKSPNTFCFDDLRLYVKWVDDPSLPPTGLNDVQFEVQIKSFLAHAWSISTHDLIYKTDKKNWAKERVAYQIKAMLEHAEISIYEVNNICRSISLTKTDRKSEKISKIIKMIHGIWDKNLLPKNIKLLAENIYNLINNVGIDLGALFKILREESLNNKGFKTLNLSPYSIVVQSLLNRETGKMQDFFEKDKVKFKIFIPREVTVPDMLKDIKSKNVLYDS